MKTYFFEATHGPKHGNWGRFLVGVMDVEWAWTSEVDPGRALPVATRVSPDAVWVLDLVTREGAYFSPGGYARADLVKHKVWVCPMFEPFLTWLYQQLGTRRGYQYADVLAALPQVVELPDAPFALAERRQPGVGADE